MLHTQQHMLHMQQHMLHIQQHMLHIQNPTVIVVELHSFADSTFKNTKSETMNSF